MEIETNSGHGTGQWCTGTTAATAASEAERQAAADLEASQTDRLTLITTAFALATITAVAAIISYRHAYDWSVPHGEAARLISTSRGTCCETDLDLRRGGSTM